MIYLLYGEDSLRSRAKLEDIVSAFTKAAGTSAEIVRLDAEESSVEDIAGSIETGSLFAKSRLFVVERIFLADTVVQEFFTERLVRFKDAKEVFIFWDAVTDIPESKFAKSLEQSASKTQEFKALTDVTLDRWLAGELVTRNIKITSAQKQSLLAFAGSDTWRMTQELDKFALDASSIGVEDRLSAKAPNIFQLTDAIGERNKKLALCLLYRFAEEGLMPEKMFWTISWHIKNLAIFRIYLDAGKDQAYVAKHTKQHPFVVKKALAQARNFSADELTRMYQELFALDAASKKDRADMAIGLERLVLTL